MNIAFDITHPADIHQFRHCLQWFKQQGERVIVTARNSRSITPLLQLYRIEFTARRDSKGLANRVKNIIPIIAELYKIYKPFNPDLLIGGSGNMYIAQVAKLLKKKSIIFDDTEHTRIQNMLSFPFADYICTPMCYRLDKGNKQIRYNGTKELAYLHPNQYQYNEAQFRTKLESYLRITKNFDLLNELEKDKKIILLRLVAWKAAHDLFQKTRFDWHQIMKKLKRAATVIVVADDSNNPNVNRSNIVIPGDKFHDLVSFSDIVISEGATTAAEAAVLGKPAIFCNKHRLGYIDEYNYNYGLIWQVSAETELLPIVDELLSNKYLKHDFKEKQQRLLREKIDVSQWMINFMSDLNPVSKNGVKKIFIISNLDPQHAKTGGIETYVNEISKSLMNDRYQLNFVGVSENTNGISNIDPKITDKLRSTSCIDCHRHIPVYHNSIYNFSNSFNFLVNLFLKTPFIHFGKSAILHFQRPDWALPFIFRKNKKVCSIHGNPAETIKYTKHRFHYQLYNIFEKMTLPAFEKIAFVDEHTREIYRNRYPGLYNRMIVIPPCVSDQFQPLPAPEIERLKKMYGIDNHEKIILVVARLEKEKNILEILNIFYSLAINEDGQNSARLLIVGIGRLKEEMETSVRHSGNHKVTFLNYLPHDKLSQVYNLADVTFIFSLTEGMPIVALESLACGTPVICNDVGDLARLIKNGYNGSVVDRNNVRRVLDEFLTTLPHWRENCVASVKAYRADEFGKRIRELYG